MFNEIRADRTSLTLSNSKDTSRKHSESANIHPAAILNFHESHISCRNYFCPISKVGEDILHHGLFISHPAEGSGLSWPKHTVS